MYTVGQNILNGMLIVASIDLTGMIISVTVPNDKSNTGEPLVITYNYGQTESTILSFVNSIKG